LNGQTTFASGRDIAVLAFLKDVLIKCPVSVAEVERQARSAKLLRADASVTHAKLFRMAKKKLRIISFRHGFGRGGQWQWSLPADSESDVGGSREPASKNRSATVIYDADLSATEKVTANAAKPEPTSTLGASVRGRIGVPREWVNGVASLNRHRAPMDVPLHRWISFIHDSELFIDLWAAKAAALGWDAMSLFAYVPTQPLANLNRAGLVWALGGHRLVQLYRDWAAIETVDGHRVFNRRATYGTQITLPWRSLPLEKSANDDIVKNAGRPRGKAW
jgi:hypothetical protein